MKASAAASRIMRSPSTVAVFLVAVLVLLACAAPPESEKQPLVFGDLGWDSALLQNRIAQYLVEKGYGYPTVVVPGGTIDLFEAQRRGEVDVLMEIWIPNHLERWQEATWAGEIVTLGASLSKLTQSAFMIPAYLQEAHPELDNVADLGEERFRALFATGADGGSVRLISCPDGWACNEVNRAQIEGYGLSEHLEVVTPASESELHQGLFDAYGRGEAWLGYLDSVMAPSLKLDMVRLEEPAYTEECWVTTKACAYANTTLLITVLPDVLLETPEVAGMLQNWFLESDVYSSMALRRLDRSAGYGDTAIWWLENHDDIWRHWVTEDAANAIREALAAGERVEGWSAE